jgi:hypothetical protein
MIISVSGKMGSGKDSIAKIIQELQPEMGWEIKKWAGKLKQVATMLTGIPIEKWEDQEFKKEYMGDMWGMTYREFLQRLGTDAMRDGLHQNVWVNSLMAEYKLKFITIPRPDLVEEVERLGFKDPATMFPVFPNWIITDTRFINEAEAMRNGGHLSIRVNRFDSGNTHPSETNLDNYGRFDFIIDNTGTLEELRTKVGEILERVGNGK